RRQLIPNDIFALLRKHTADDEDPCVGAEAARLDTFFNAGDTDPVCACTRHSRAAQRKRGPIGVCLDDWKQIDVRVRQLRKETIIVLESAGGDFDPAGTGWN